MKPSGAFFLLFLLFLGLKLAGEIAWAWIWVLAPLWIPITAGLLFGFATGFNGAYKRARTAQGTPAKVGGNAAQAIQPGEEQAQPGETLLHNGQRNVAKAEGRSPAPRATVSALPEGRKDNSGPRRRSH